MNKSLELYENNFMQEPIKQVIQNNPFEKFEIHPNTLTRFGFTPTEVSLMLEAVGTFGRVPVAELQQMGMNLEQAKRIRYAYEICCGKVVIESDDDLCRHLRRMFGQHKRLELHDLALSTVERVPRFAVVAKIEDKIYQRLNSRNYSVKQRLYPVESVSASKITIKVDKQRKPIIPFGYPKKVDGLLEVLEVDTKSGIAKIALSHEVCRLCNRYAIVASFRRPEFHLGLMEIICFEGSKVYIFATDVGIKEKPNLSGGSARVYAYGTFQNNIQTILRSVTAQVFQKMRGVKVNTVDATAAYQIVSLEPRKDDIIE